MLTLAIASTLLSGQTVIAFAPSRISHVQRLHSCTNKSSTGPSTTSLCLGDFFNFGKTKEEDSETPTATASNVQPEGEEYYDEDDPIEKIFGVFFGKKEKAPMG